ncbi:hypothetical protein PR048_014558 [Dryococelus australis]|uniref:Uncharacterized protein n=1 Tax=Dryococelus australis TaxID=614101 RepID=A0ABQ9HES3_9NEOP|nr:hypothetical protein PR048_014558 [Dryococelus australis]
MTTKRGGYGAAPECQSGENVTFSENSPTSGVIRHDPHLRKFGSDLYRETKHGSEYGAVPEWGGGGKREIPEKTCRSRASSGTIPTCESPVTGSGIEPGWPCRIVVSMKKRRGNSNFTYDRKYWPRAATSPEAEILGPSISLEDMEQRMISQLHAICWCTCAGRGKREIPEKPRRPTASSGTSPTCENPIILLGIETGSPWWEASVLIAQPPWPPENCKRCSRSNKDISHSSLDFTTGLRPMVSCRADRVAYIPAIKKCRDPRKTRNKLSAGISEE